MKRKCIILVFIFTLLMTLTACSKIEISREQIAEECTDLINQYIPEVDWELIEDNEYQFIVYKKDNPSIYTSIDYDAAKKALGYAYGIVSETPNEFIHGYLCHLAYTHLFYEDIQAIIREVLPADIKYAFYISFGYQTSEHDSYTDSKELLEKLQSVSDFSRPRISVSYLLDSKATDYNESKLKLTNQEINQRITELMTSQGIEGFTVYVDSAVTDQPELYDGYRYAKAWDDFRGPFYRSHVESWYPAATPETTETPNCVLSEVLNDLYYESFEYKHYFDLLDQSARSSSLERYYFNNKYLIYDDYISFHGNGIELDYYFSDHLYNLYLLDSFSYTIDGVEKKAELVLSNACYEDGKNIYSGRLTTSDGEVFFIGFDEQTAAVLDNDEFSETKGNPIQFEQELNDWLVSMFKKAGQITSLQYPVCYQWEQEITQVLNGEKELDSMKDAQDIMFD